MRQLPASADAELLTGPRFPNGVGEFDKGICPRRIRYSKPDPLVLSVPFPGNTDHAGLSASRCDVAQLTVSSRLAWLEACALSPVDPAEIKFGRWYAGREMSCITWYRISTLMTGRLCCGTA
ncbi:UNVERIFIED_CONTAM: hypothetical protein GTU68_030208 [Idotea baltica]|nr:hypothetical protein [Idotea baltica]